MDPAIVDLLRQTGNEGTHSPQLANQCTFVPLWKSLLLSYQLQRPKEEVNQFSRTGILDVLLQLGLQGGYTQRQTLSGLAQPMTVQHGGSSPANDSAAWWV